MNTDSSDLIPVASLFERYKIAKSVIYKRMKDLEIQTQKIGIRAFITQHQLNLLDALHEFIQGGGNTAEFLYFRGIDPDEDLAGF
ncbi:MAG: hypothetical protein AAFQ40_06450 [Cyanobacteria bacterium J06623_5]